MNLNLNHPSINRYKSNSQKIRVLSEYWVSGNMYCPNCGNLILSEFPNNKPVADFFCSSCSEEYELKSKKGSIGKKIVDGAFHTMIDRISSSNNPNFFFLSYNISSLSIMDFILIPKHFFTPSIIEKRNPLGENAKRAGWVGCNINFSEIPELGKIYIIQNSQVAKKEGVIKKWQKSLFLRKKVTISKGWLIDVLQCIDRIGKIEFTINDVYGFEKELKFKYPNNSFIKEKIRQQLQVLRDQGIIEFKGKGLYRNILDIN